MLKALLLIITISILIILGNHYLFDKNHESDQGETYFAPYFMGEKLVWGKDKEQIEKKAQGFTSMILVNEHINQKPTEQQLKAANELQNETWNAIKKNHWYEVERAQSDGFRNLPNDLIHYGNPKFLQDGEILNPEKPEYLMFYEINGLKQIVGVMFLLNGIEDTGPQIGGEETVWHYHISPQATCILKDITMSETKSKQECLIQGGDWTHRTHQMLHLWFVDHPEGRFGTMMYFESKHYELLEPYKKDLESIRKIHTNNEPKPVNKASRIDGEIPKNTN